MRIPLILFFTLAIPFYGQQAPARYIVELEGAPLGFSAPLSADAPARRAAAERLLRTQAQFAERLAALPGSRITASMTTVINAVAVEISPEAAEELSELPGVVRVYPVVNYRPLMDSAPAVHRAPEAWSAIGGQDRAGEGVKVAILDTCIEVSHPALQDPSMAMPPGYPVVNRPEDVAYTSNKVIVTRNYKRFYGVAGDLTPRPRHPHATQIASVIGGVAHMTPMGPFSGVAPKAWLGNYCIASPDPADDQFRGDVAVKAFDDAVADGMDVISLSLGSVDHQLRPEDDIMAKMYERAVALGVIVVQSAGNDGPEPNTVGDNAALPAAIVVGATWNSRVMGSMASVGGKEYTTIPSAETANLQPITAALVDVRTIDGSGFGCGALPPGSLTGKIAFMTLGGNCTTSVKTSNAQAAGAVAAIIGGGEQNRGLFRMGRRVIPSVAVTEEDAKAIRDQLGANPNLEATLRFQISPRPFNAHRLTDFSSRGPTGKHLLKPDLVAVGAELYMAELEGAYGLAQGTSFSGPIVAGAAALLKSARPGLNAIQYRSLLVNSAAPPQTGQSTPARLTEYGAGILNIEAALKSTVAVDPVSLSIGVERAAFDKTFQLLVMNLSASTARFELRVVPHQPGPAPTLSDAALEIPPRGAKPVTVSFRATGLPAGEYQGFIEVRSSDGSLARVPYWGAVPAPEPQVVTILSAATSGTAGRRVDRAIVFRLTDNNGVIFTQAQPTVSMVKGGGSVFRVYSRDAIFPGQFAADVILGDQPGDNVFRIQAGSASREVTIRGVAPTAESQRGADGPSAPAPRAPRSPLAFEPNRGQAAREAALVGTASAGRVVLMQNRMRLLPRAGAAPEAAFEIALVGASLSATWAPEQLLPGKSHYFRGAERKHWILDVPQYGRARLRSVYPGIDLVLYGRDGKLEFDFEVAPGADASRIALRYSGFGAPEIDPDRGDLVFRSPVGEIRQHRPVIYQRVAGKTKLVDGAYVTRDDGTVGFQLGPYDPTLELVIDPVISYGTYFGGQRGDSVNAIAVDAQGNVYVAGTTQTAGASGSVLPDDVFVAKLNPTGTAALYTTYIGGSSDDRAAAIAIDSQGNVYVAGTTFSRDFPTTPGAYSRRFGDFSTDVRGDAFVVKVTPDGSGIAYATYLGGDEGDAGLGIAVDGKGQVHITGSTYSDNWPTTQDAYRRTNCPGFGYDGFYARLNPEGTALVYSTYLCGSAHDLPRAVTADRDGNAYIAGQTDSADFPTSAGAYQRQLRGADDAFIAKFGATGSLMWATLLGGSASDSANAVAVDSSGNVYLAGSTNSVNLPVTAGVFQSNQANQGQGSDAFVAGLSTAGDRVRFLTYLGGKGDDAATGIAVDAAGKIYVAGLTHSTDFPTTSGPRLTGYRGAGDAFVARLSAQAASLEFSLYLGGNERDFATSVATDVQGNLYAGGQTFSPNFSTTPEAFRSAYDSGLSGVSDGFVVKVSPGASPQAPCVAVNGVLNNGSMLPGPVSPGEIFTVFGDGLGPRSAVTYQLTPDGRMSGTLGTTRIYFDDTPAPIIFTSQYQVAGIVPYAVAGKSSTVMRIEHEGRSTAPLRVRVAAASPAILTLNASGKGPGAVLNQDYQLNSAQNPAPRGSAIMIFATGEGQTNPPGVDGKFAEQTLPTPQLPVKVLFGSAEGRVLYAGAAPGLVAGVLQVNVVVPENIPAGSAVPLTLIVGDRRSPPGPTVAIK